MIASGKPSAGTGISAAAIPAPPTNSSIVNVKVGGNRTGVSGVTGLAGVVLGLYTTTTATTPSYTCTSDADGDCNFTVPNTQPGGANRNARFYVKAISAPSGWLLNQTLRTGEGDGTNSQTTAYQFQTPQLQSGQTYTSTEDFMVGSGNTNRTASGGIWQLSKTNPTLPTSCGLDVALLLDLSGSVGSQVTALRGAADTLVNALQGTPSRMSLFSFSGGTPADNASQNYPALTSVATAAQGTAFKARYSTWTAGGGTNWDVGLAAVANATDVPDIVIIITDGNPTFYNNPASGPGDFTRLREVENGIFSANAIRSQGARVIALGVGAGVSDSATAQNLAAISGPTAYNGSNGAVADYYQAATYGAAGTALRNLALGNCTGSVSVTKMIVPSANTGENISGATVAGAGWTFAGSSSNSAIGGLPASRTTIGDGTGTVNFPLTFPGGTSSAPVTVTETQQSGYTLVTQSSQNAVCTNLTTGAAVTITNTTLGFTVNAPSSAAISCTMYNRAPQPPATIQVDKTWTINGTSYLNGNQPGDFQAQLTLTGPNGAAASNQGWGVVRTGYSIGNTATVAETVTMPELCTLTSSTIVRTGSTTSSALPYTATLSTATNTFMVTNVVTCTARLTLVKEVVGGTALPTAWNLQAVAPTGALAGPNGASDSAAATNVVVTPGVVYQLRESGGPPEYVQDDNRTNLESNPLSTGSMACVEIDAAGNVVPGFADGINGGVRVPLGSRVRCTATNRTAELRLVKEVINNNGGTATPANWNLTATPTGTFPSGLLPVTRPGATATDAQYFTVRPGVSYALSETGPTGYANTSIQCSIEGGARVNATNVTLTAGQRGTCYLVNDDQPTQLTLVKVVNNGTTGATAVPANWTMTASGPTTVTGPGNSAAVTNQTVNAGTYTLSESGGPAGYTASTWSCTGGTLTGNSLVLPNGASATCTITNTAIQPRLTLVKVVDNGTTGATTAATAWTLTAAGPSTITGATGSGTVTNAAVPVGTFNLSEAGPAGYTASNWVCTGAASTTATSVTLALASSATCTITNTAIAPRLTLVKQVVNANGGTALPTAWTLTGTGPVTVTGTSGSAAVTNAAVQVGAYALTETDGPPGYTASAWTCTGATLTNSTVTLALGSNATCTITNTDQPARLTLVKVVDNGTTGATAVPANWTLSATGPATVSGPGNSAAVTNQSVPAGSYTLQEAGGPAGYTPSSWSCVGGTLAAGAVTVPNGGNVTCTITNTAIAPRLTLVKQVVNANGGTAVPTAWQLTATSAASAITGQTGSAAVTNAVVPVGVYTLSEAGPTGYTASAWSCTGATVSGSTVTITAGSNVTCTIVNTDQPALLTLVKVVDNGDTGATATPADWTLSAAGSITVTGAGNSAEVTAQTVPAGNYTLSETDGPSGYTASAWNCGTATVTGSTVTVPNGGDVTCTITNTAVAPTLTLVKVVDNGNTGATTAATAWTLTADGPSRISGATGSASVTDATANVGTYQLSESTIPGYSASAWVCTGGTGSTESSVTLAAGSNATCTITNTAIAPTLTLVKQVQNNYGGTAIATDWTLTGVGPLSISGVSGSPAVTGAVVQTGVYNLSEAGGPGGYAAGEWNCGDADLTGAAVTVPLGTDVTCTIVNSDLPAQLTLVKVVDANNSGTTRVPADWTLTATPQGITGQDPVSGNGDPATPGGVDAVEVFAGNYQLSETGPAGFDGSLWQCTGGVVADDVVTVPNAGNVTCTITNTAVAPTLTLVKQIDDPNNMGTAVATDWTLSASGPSPINGVTGSPAVTAAAVEVGEYTLSESGPANYTASDWRCVAADQSPVAVTDDAVTLAEGDNVTCTVVNTPVPPQWAISKSSNPLSGSTVQPGDEITYTVTVIRGDGVDPQNVVVNDDLSAVLNNATLVTGPTTTAGTASITGSALTWTVPVLDSPFVTVTYTVRVNDDAWNVTLRNQVTSPGSSPCVPVGDDARRALGLAVTPLDVPWEDGECPTTTQHYTPSWSLQKTSDPASGSTVAVGSTITYTLTVTNTSAEATLTGASVTDDLSDVLQHASLGAVGAGGSVTGNTLTWAVPDLAPGEQATLSYTVNVNTDAYDVSFRNVATPGPGGECTVCTTTHETPPKPDGPNPPLPQTGTNASLEGVLIGLLLSLGGVGALVVARRRRRD
ncbi:VWA domain-containing protein [Micropruina glycogenica]|uniref:DUF7927 domain-containing protein n=1 Tax=Micropruina glycogenica TaxID=75385 RepID=UPI000CF6AB5D